MINSGALHVLGFFVCVFIAVGMGDCITARGEIEHCYVETNTYRYDADGATYYVKGYREWRSDTTIFVTRDGKEAIEVAKKCMTAD